MDDNALKSTDPRLLRAQKLSVVKLQARGLKSAATSTRVISVNDVDYALNGPSDRGIQLVVLLRDTHAPETGKPLRNYNYDTTNPSDATLLAGQLDGLGTDHIAILVSRGSLKNLDVPVSGNAALSLGKALLKMGASPRIWTMTDDDAYILIGRPFLGVGTATELIQDTKTGDPSTSAILVDRDAIAPAAPAPSNRGVYTHWGVGACMNGGTTIANGWMFGSYYTHGSSPTQECLSAGAQGATASYQGDLLYETTLEGPVVQPGVILTSHNVRCARCLAPRGQCFVAKGAQQTCPAGFTAQYTGYFYGSHYTHAQEERVCIDHLNFDNSGTSATGSYLYPTSTNAVGGSGATLGQYIGCTVCCGG